MLFYLRYNKIWLLLVIRDYYPSTYIFYQNIMYDVELNVNGEKHFIV